MKLVKIDSCKNIFFCLVLLLVTFFNVILLFSNAYGEQINVNSLLNSSDGQALNKTTNSNFPSENTIDNKEANQVTEKFFAHIKQINESKAVIEVFPITSHGAVLENDSNSSTSNLLSSSRNYTSNEVNNTKLLPPPSPIISYIENEGAPLNATNFVIKDSAINTSEEENDDESNRNTSEEEDDDESNRNTSEEEGDDESNRNTSEEEDDDESNRNTSEEEDDDESNRNTSEEEDDDESNRNTSEEEDDDESNRNTSEEEDDDESNRNTSEEEDDDESNRNTSEEEDDDESNRNTSEEEDDDESNRNTSQLNTTELYYKKPTIVPAKELIGTKTIGNSIDNENDKLISQFSELNSSLIPNLQIQTDDYNSKTKDRKPIANAGLDQVITSNQNIVLDASASFDTEGKISSYLWKQIGNVEGKINPSNSMIYSFPIPEGLEENSLKFMLIVMDKKGQIDTDTINFLINHENVEKNET